MFSPLRNRFGIPGVISVIALVFAMFGGAYAASDNGGSGKATASAKKGPRGPRGPKGPKGPVGPAGPAGAKGDAGAAGANGKDDAPGAPGKNGESVTVAAYAGPECEEAQGEEGVKLSNASGTAYACNGEDGEDGEDGETGFTETLPPGKTETGTWGFAGGLMVPGEPPTPNQASIPVSFTIPLAAKISPAGNIIYFKKSQETCEAKSEPEKATCLATLAENCPGVTGKPAAKAGFLCIYQATLLSASYVSPLNLATSGVVLNFMVSANGAVGQGSWAVTAPAP